MGGDGKGRVGRSWVGCVREIAAWLPLEGILFFFFQLLPPIHYTWPRHEEEAGTAI